MYLQSSTSYSPSLLDIWKQRTEHLKVMIIGNNPSEITSVYNILRQIRKKNYMTDVCFSIKDGLLKMVKSTPDCILLDDNIVIDQLKELKGLMKKLRKSSRLRHVPVVLMKSDNMDLVVANSMQDYILKNTLDADILTKTIEKNIQDKK